MSRRAHAWWWTAIVASWGVSLFVSERLGGDTWPARSVKAFYLAPVTFYLMHRLTPDDQPVSSLRTYAWGLLWFVLIAVGLGYVFSR